MSASNYAEAIIAVLELDPYGTEALTISCMVDQMRTAHDRITSAARSIRSRLDTVDARFAEGEGDLVDVHLNSLGELQALGPEYDAAVSAYEATRAQLALLTIRLAREQAKSTKPKPTGPTLYVRNPAQKILWDEELAGQISDGHWENARPYDHWKVWCDATVAVRPEAVGRTFYARRSSYNFTDPELLSIIGERMVGYVQRVAPGYNAKDLKRDLADLKTIIKTATSHDAQAHT